MWLLHTLLSSPLDSWTILSAGHSRKKFLPKRNRPKLADTIFVKWLLARGILTRISSRHDTFVKYCDSILCQFMRILLSSSLSVGHSTRTFLPKRIRPNLLLLSSLIAFMHEVFWRGYPSHDTFVKYYDSILCHFTRI